MTITQMLTALGYRLNDPNSVRFVAAERYVALNDTIDHLTRTLPLGLLSELETPASVSTGLGSNSRYSELSKTTPTPNILRFISGLYRNSISSAIYPCDSLNIQDEWKTENNLVYKDYRSPVSIELKTSVRFYPSLPSGYVIDYVYIPEPTRITSGVETVLATDLHPLIVECAEAILKGASFEMDNIINKFLRKS